MTHSRLLFAGLAASLLAGSASIALAQQGPPPEQGQYGAPPQGGYGPPPQQGGYGPPPDQGRYQGGHPARFLSPEQKIMWMMDTRGELRGMSPDQRHASRAQMLGQLDAMNDADKAKLRDRLQAEWNSLPPEEQQAFEERLAERRGQSEQRRAGAQGQYGAPSGPSGPYQGPPPGQGQYGPPAGQDGQYQGPPPQNGSGPNGEQ